MSGFFQTDVQDALLDRYWGGGAPDAPATWYIALLTTLPDFDGNGGVEAAYTDYARAAVTNDPTEWPAASAGAKSNANDIDYGTAGSGPTSIVGFAFLASPTDPLGPTPLWAVVEVTGSPVTVNNGADVKFPSGAIDLTRCV